MPGHSAFLKEIAANPDDDLPRLVYADWLDEQGDPRGEFIRIQCLLPKISLDDDRYFALKTRETLLRRQFGKGWANPVREHVSNWEFRRGFVERITLPAERFLDRAPELFAGAPIRGVRLLRPLSQLSALAASPWLEQLASLDLSHSNLDPINFEDIAYSPAATNLSELHLRDTGLCNHQGLRMLAECEFFRNLRVLDLSQLRRHPYLGGRSTERRYGSDPYAGWQLAAPLDPIGESAIEALANSPYLKNLETLKLAGHGDAGGVIMAVLAESPLLEHLQHLDLSHNDSYLFDPNTGDALECVTDRLFQSKVANNLRSLNLHRTYAADAGAAYAESPSLGNLETLNLTGMYPYRFLTALTTTSKNSLLSLNVSHNVTGDFAIELPSQYPIFPQLRELVLDNIEVSDEGVGVLPKSHHLRNLRALRIREAPKVQRGNSTNITKAGVKSLAASDSLKNLQVLDLGLQPVAGCIKTLEESSFADSLLELGLWNTNLKRSEIDRLCDPAVLPNLELLDLRSVAMDDELKVKLRDRFGAGVRFGPGPEAKRRERR